MRNASTERFLCLACPPSFLRGFLRWLLPAVKSLSLKFLSEYICPGDDLSKGFSPSKEQSSSYPYKAKKKIKMNNYQFRDNNGLMYATVPIL